jgi:hypothetical protein
LDFRGFLSQNWVVKDRSIFHSLRLLNKCLAFSILTLLLLLLFRLEDRRYNRTFNFLYTLHTLRPRLICCNDSVMLLTISQSQKLNNLNLFCVRICYNLKLFLFCASVKKSFFDAINIYRLLTNSHLSYAGSSLKISKERVKTVHRAAPISFAKIPKNRSILITKILEIQKKSVPNKISQPSSLIWHHCVLCAISYFQDITKIKCLGNSGSSCVYIYSCFSNGFACLQQQRTHL